MFELLLVILITVKFLLFVITYIYIYTNYYYFVKLCVSHIFLFLNRSTCAVFHKTNRFLLIQIFSIQSKWHLPPQQIHYVCWHHEGGNYCSAQTFPSNRRDTSLLMLNMFILLIMFTQKQINLAASLLARWLPQQMDLHI